MRILKRITCALKDLVSQVLTFDYLGALAVSLAFPLVLVPQLGLIRTGAAVRPAECRGGAVGAVAVPRTSCGASARTPLACARDAGAAGRRLCRRPTSITTWPKTASTPTASSSRETSALPAHRGHHGPGEGRAGTAVPQRQPAVPARDEYRYHEALVHPAMAAFTRGRRADARCWCWAAATAWRCARSSSTPACRAVTLVELDPAMTHAVHAATARWRALNGHALASPKVQGRQRRRLQLARRHAATAST